MAGEQGESKHTLTEKNSVKSRASWGKTVYSVPETWNADGRLIGRCPAKRFVGELSDSGLAVGSSHF
tara:strand:+ start:915 stop:1115 length:201 start_codon:yes stop_codon:yes gene_type:complete